MYSQLGAHVLIVRCICTQLGAHVLSWVHIYLLLAALVGLVDVESEAGDATDHQGSASGAKRHGLEKRLTVVSISKTS